MSAVCASAFAAPRQASPDSAIDCTFRNCTNKWTRYNGGRWKGCTMENSMMWRIDCTNTYQNCTFRNSSLSFAVQAGQTYDGCTFENVRFPTGGFNPKRFKGEIRPNCKYDEKCVFPDGWVSGSRGILDR